MNLKSENMWGRRPSVNHVVSRLMDLLLCDKFVHTLRYESKMLTPVPVARRRTVHGNLVLLFPLLRLKV
ncbi:hypothetical protein C0J52_09289 [Blattella germanica]|nr:hypothetical protein C0J52_09289 [Blattella germanica]